MSEEISLINQIESLVFSSQVPLSVDKIMKTLGDPKPPIGEVRSCLESLRKHYENRGVQLVEVATGWRFQVALDCSGLIVKTLEEKPTRLSRALLETLALIAYRQPITRAEIEAIRGVVVSSHMVKTLLEHEWVRVVGHKDVPGKPALYATTKTFLDDMNLKKLEDLPPLSELKELIPDGQEELSDEKGGPLHNDYKEAEEIIDEALHPEEHQQTIETDVEETQEPEIEVERASEEESVESVVEAAEEGTEQEEAEESAEVQTEEDALQDDDAEMNQELVNLDDFSEVVLTTPSDPSSKEEVPDEKEQTGS